MEKWITEAVSDLPPLAHCDDVIKIMPLSRRTLYRLIADGKLKAIKVRSSRSSPWLIPRDEVARFLEELNSGGSAADPN